MSTKLNVVPGMEAYAEGLDLRKTCKHIDRVTSDSGRKNFIKCGVIRHRWTHGPGTDIRAKSPACRFWEAVPPEHDYQGA